MTLNELTTRMAPWWERNFPHATSDQAFKGLVEEVGELAHADLKSQQGIRGTQEEHQEAGMDAVGDILIYLAHYCHLKGWSMEGCAQMALKEVLDRDWQANPTTGASCD